MQMSKPPGGGDGFGEALAVDGNNAARTTTWGQCSRPSSGAGRRRRQRTGGTELRPNPCRRINMGLMLVKTKRPEKG